MGWMFPKASASNSSQSAGKIVSGYHHGSAYVLRSEYWSGDFALGDANSGDSSHSSLTERLLFIRPSDGWSGDDE